MNELVLVKVKTLSLRRIGFLAQHMTHWLLGLCPKPHLIFFLYTKKKAKKVKTASPHRPDSCLFAKRQITHLDEIRRDSNSLSFALRHALCADRVPR